MSHAFGILRRGIHIVSRLNLNRYLTQREFSFMNNFRNYCASNSANDSASTSYIVQMRGLDFEATEDDIVGYFAPLQITPVRVNLTRDLSGRAHGLCEVEFATPAEVVTAMRKKNAFMGNKFIRLSYKSSASIKDFNIGIGENLSASNMSLSSRLSGGLKHYLRMRNLPNKITDQMIFEFFLTILVRPVAIEVVYDETGCRTGEVDVAFSSHADLTKALCKNNSRFGQQHVELIPKDELEETNEEPKENVSN